MPSKPSSQLRSVWQVVNNAEDSNFSKEGLHNTIARVACSVSRLRMVDFRTRSKVGWFIGQASLKKKSGSRGHARVHFPHGTRGIITIMKSHSTPDWIVSLGFSDAQLYCRSL